MFDEFDPSADPIALIQEWFGHATASEPNDPGAMALATVGADGSPDVRIVLLRGVDQRGMVFFTNLQSAKGGQLEQNPEAALCLHWKSLRRQIRVRGRVEKVSAAEADAYFAGRPREARIGAWASRQSQPLSSREALDAAVAETAAQYPDERVPRPDFWSGFRVIPQEIEFWAEGPFRLHQRMLFTRKGKGWAAGLLYP